MHLAEGILPLGQAALWGACAAPLLAWSVRGEQLARRTDPSSAVLIAGATSLLFAATLLQLPVPVVGATSHICLTPVLALIVGVRRILWPTAFVLLLQALFFAHGGLTTLGVNMLTLGLLGPLCTVALWRLLRGLGLNSALGLALACAAGDLSVYLADAVVLAFAFADTAPPMTTFTGVLLGFAPVQGPLALLEAVASVGIVRLLATRRPELLPDRLKGLRASALPAAAALLLLSLFTTACSYEGIDGTVFAKTAESAGHPATPSLVDLSQGELGLGASILVLFGLGFFAGRSWERLFGRGSDAPSR